MGSGTFPRCPFFWLTHRPSARRQILSRMRSILLRTKPLIWRPLFFVAGERSYCRFARSSLDGYPGVNCVEKFGDPEQCTDALSRSLRVLRRCGGRIHRLEKMEANRIEAAVSVAAMRVILGHVEAPRFFSSVSKIRLYLHSTFDVSGRRVISNNFPRDRLTSLAMLVTFDAPRRFRFIWSI